MIDDEAVPMVAIGADVRHGGWSAVQGCQATTKSPSSGQQRKSFPPHPMPRQFTGVPSLCGVTIPVFGRKERVNQYAAVAISGEFSSQEIHRWLSHHHVIFGAMPRWGAEFRRRCLTPCLRGNACYNLPCDLRWSHPRHPHQTRESS